MSAPSRGPTPGAGAPGSSPPWADPSWDPGSDAAFVTRVRKAFEPLVRYHRFTAVGTENLPKEGAFLLVVHHTLATYDGFLVGGAVWEATGRLPRGLGDDRIFQIPGLSTLARRLGIVPASPVAGEELLRAGHIVGLAPGGMWESLRPRGEKRRSRWDDRKGFVRLALRTGVPMVLGACPAGDDIFTVYPSRVTDRVYQRFHWPVPIARGVGPTLTPRPVRLTAYFSEPIHPPPWEPEREVEQVDALHALVKEKMAELLRKG